MSDIYHYAYADYMATGEGRTISVLITRAYPRTEDYEELPSLKNGWNGTLKGDVKAIVQREMETHIGAYFAIGTEHLTRDEFILKAGRFVPDVVMKMSDYEANEKTTFGNPGNLKFFATFHYNFS